MASQYVGSAEDPAEALAEYLRAEKWEWPRGRFSYFIPIDEVERLVNGRAVRKVLLNLYPNLDEESLAFYTIRICVTAPKIFTILLCSSNGMYRTAILDIIRENVTDEDLPLVRIYPGGGPNYRDQRRDCYTLGKKSHDLCTLDYHGDCGLGALSSRRPSGIPDLCRDQWLVLAPVFHRYQDFIKHHNLHESIILPYTYDQENEPGKIKLGGYSEVWGVKIHSAHQKMMRSTTSHGPLIAVKRLFSRKPEDFQKEQYMLSQLTLKNHPHLVKLLTTYKFKDQYHLLCPYAKANLREYWIKNPFPRWNWTTVLWSLTQLRGLASALDVIHNFKTAEHTLGFDNIDPLVSRHRPSMAGRMIVDINEEKYGRHGDLKPENILWSDELEDVGPTGILQIADLGLGRFHRLESRSRQDPTTINGSPTYVPPELALQKLVSRAYDIWSLGCIFLEFVTWMLKGSVGVSKFADARLAMAHDSIEDDTFYTVYNSSSGRSGRTRPEVIEWIKMLRKHKRYSKMVRDLLDLVEKDMLRVDANERIRSGELKDRLSKMANRGQESPQYLVG